MCDGGQESVESDAPTPKSSNDVASGDATELALNNFPVSGNVFCFFGGGSTESISALRRVTRRNNIATLSACQDAAVATVGNAGLLFFFVI